MTVARETDKVDMLKTAATILGGILLALTTWLGDSVASNTITLAQLTIKMDQVLETQVSNTARVEGLIAETSLMHKRNVDRLDGHFTSIWPRLREIKERVQYLESSSSLPRAQDKWKY